MNITVLNAVFAFEAVIVTIVSNKSSRVLEFYKTSSFYMAKHTVALSSKPYRFF